LFLSHAERRQLFGRTMVNAPSPFLQDIPFNLVEHRGEPDTRDYEEETVPIYSPATHKKSKDGYRVGMRVHHQVFGTGIIKDRSGGGDNVKLTVHFSDYGIKKLVQKFAGLTVVS